jgi:hypothetical protein
MVDLLEHLLAVSKAEHWAGTMVDLLEHQLAASKAVSKAELKAASKEHMTVDRLD